MNPERPDQISLHWLAAYADAELPPPDCASVEDWLCDNPEGRELIEAQEFVGPNNAELWQAVKPPMPSTRQWRKVADRVHQGSRRAVIRRRVGRASAAALVATAAALVMLLPDPAKPPVDAPYAGLQPTTRVIVADEPIELASDADIVIVSLPEAAADLLLMGEHPLRGSVLEFARGGDIEFFGVGSDPAGRFPEVPTSDAAANDITMIWAPRAP
jgi:hypothetical protein